MKKNYGLYGTHIGKLTEVFMKFRIIMALLLLATLAFSSCSLFSSFNTDNSEDYEGEVTAVSFDKQSFSVAGGESDYITLSITPSSVKSHISPKWTYDSTCISLDGDSSGAVITGIKSGYTWVKCTVNNIVATCIINVTSDSESIAGVSPYIYSDTSVVELAPGSSQTVTVSLYGGNIAQYEDFVWSIKDSSIATISSARNNCVITAKAAGSTQLTAHHPDSAYDYSIVVFVHADTASGVPYITTTSNVLSIDKTSVTQKKIYFSVQNTTESQAKILFHYEDTSDTSGIVDIAGSANELVITPLKSGTARITVTNDLCDYSLNVLVIVSTSVSNVYVTTSDSSVIVDGSSTTYSVYAYVEGYDGYADPEAFVWTMPDESTHWSDYMSVDVSGNAVQITGKKNGVFRITVGHPLSDVTRTILVVLRNQDGSAVDSSMYITTTSNYVQTKVGADTTDVTVTLVGGEDGDQNDFVWTIANGSANDLVTIETTTGTVASRSAAASGTDAYGILHITPNTAGNTGSVTVSVSHPKCLYKTDILVKVYSKYALLTDPVTLSIKDTSGNEKSVISLLNSSTSGVQLNASLANDSTSGAENSIAWASSDTSKVTASPSSGAASVIAPCGRGTGQTYITVSHPDAVSSKRVLVLTADTQEELDSMKYLYADNTYFRGNSGSTFSLSLGTYGFSDTEKKQITWSVTDPSICTVSADSTHLSPVVTGVASGETTVTASYSGCTSVSYDITILPSDESTGVIEPSYLTTTLNAVVISSTGNTADLSVTGVNISSSDMANYTGWEITPGSDTSIVSIAKNGGKATLTALASGKTSITVSNKYSANTVVISVKVGAVYEYQDDTYVYVTTSSDTYTMLNGATMTIGAALENSTKTGGFSFKVTSGSDIIDVTGALSGTCIVEAKAAGKAFITISNTYADFSKEILVVVGNTAGEISGVKYLSTTQNVVSVNENGNLTVSVTIENSGSTVTSGYTWTSSSPDIVSVVSSGAVAVFYGKKAGSTKITVTNDVCDYPLEIIATCVDPDDASSNPYITSSNILTLTVGDSASTLTADLAGGSESDYSNFTWMIADSSVATLYASNETAKVKAVKEGVTQITISHPKAGIARKVLVICEPASTTNYYITTSESIIRMSPDDDTKTITATLVNGSDGDNYNFKWWADNYDIINMNYTSNCCTVTPLSTGTVNIYCSNPKAANMKTVVLTITKYTTFAFASEYTTLTAGQSSFIEMETPVSSTATFVSYTSNDDSVVSTGASTKEVCVLDPHKAGSANITAKLYASDTNTLLGTAYLLCYVEAASADTTYISYTGDTLVTLAKGDSATLSATLAGSSAVSGDAAGLVWTIKGDGVLSTYPSYNSSYQVTGSTVRITALKAGYTTAVTISHSKCSGKNRSIYVVVPGSEDPSIALDKTSMSLLTGASASKITASINNAADGDYTNLKWTNSNAKVVTLSGSGKTVTVTPAGTGTAVITATVPSCTAATAACTITVTKQPGLSFDTSSFNTYPGNSNTVTYTVTPASDAIRWKISDSKYLTCTDNGHNTGTGIGTLTIVGKPTEGTASVTGTTDSGATGTVTVDNSFNYYFTVDKTMISTTPGMALASKSGDTMCIKYQVRPACSKVYVNGLDSTAASSKHLSIDTSYTGNGGPWNASYVSGSQYLMDSSKVTVDETTGIATGYIYFKSDGEVNTPLTIEAVNYDIPNNGDPVTAGKETVQVNIYNTSLTIVPYRSGTGTVGVTNTLGKYSYWDTTTNSFVIGDGEKVSFDWGCTQTNAYGSKLPVEIRDVTFVENGSETGVKGLDTNLINDDSTKTDKQGPRIHYCGTANGSGTGGSTGPYLTHDWDYGWSTGTSSYLPVVSSTAQLTSLYNRKSSDILSVESVNSSARTVVQAGTLKITYNSYSSGNVSKTYTIKVYCVVRNCSRSYTD
jgi:hypothetical protein